MQYERLEPFKLVKTAHAQEARTVRFDIPADYSEGARRKVFY